MASRSEKGYLYETVSYLNSAIGTSETLGLITEALSENALHEVLAAIDERENWQLGIPSWYGNRADYVDPEFFNKPRRTW